MFATTIIVLLVNIVILLLFCASATTVGDAYQSALDAATRGSYSKAASLLEQVISTVPGRYEIIVSH